MKSRFPIYTIEAEERLENRVADPGAVDPDPNWHPRNKPDVTATKKTNSDPNQNLEKKTGSGSDLKTFILNIFLT